MTSWNLFDHYSLRARLQPGLITLLPIALGVFAWSEPGARWMTALWTTLGTSGATYLLAIMARNRGKAIEPALWESWGGTPTTQLLRHSGPGNPVLRERWHESLAKLLKKPLPTASEEAADPAAADAVYVAVTRLLINERRDAKAFPLIYKENVNYGFCRNLHAQRAVGIGAAITGIAASVAAGIYFAAGGKVLILPWVCAAIGFLMLLSWIFVFTGLWVKVPAFAYSERLLESSDAQPKVAKPRAPKAKTPGK
jgi:hypothetical protein